LRKKCHRKLPDKVYLTVNVFLEKSFKKEKKRMPFRSRCLEANGEFRLVVRVIFPNTTVRK